MAIGPCSNDDDDDVQPTLRITDVASSYVVLNECDIGGSMATEFVFTLAIESSPEIDVDGVEFDLLWSDGSDSQNIFEDNFDLSEETLVFDWCFRYGTLDWFELDIKLLAENEEIESNTYTIRVEKPEGAN